VLSRKVDLFSTLFAGKASIAGITTRAFACRIAEDAFQLFFGKSPSSVYIHKVYI
jgi:hypothetical protein